VFERRRVGSDCFLRENILARPLPPVVFDLARSAGLKK
jgi:hypothetical protein